MKLSFSSVCISAIAVQTLCIANVSAEIQFEFDAPQQQIRVTKTTEAPVASAIVLKNTLTDETIKADALKVVADEKNGGYLIQFPLLKDKLLPDGTYTIRVGDQSGEFFVLAGDVNRDRKVDSLDFNIISGNFGVVAATYSNGDVNYDGTVDSKDLNIYTAQNGKSLPAPTSQPTTKPS